MSFALYKMCTYIHMLHRMSYIFTFMMRLMLLIMWAHDIIYAFRTKNIIYKIFLFCLDFLFLTQQCVVMGG